MNTDKQPDDEVEKTLRSLDGIERASPPPFFSTRVQARLERRQADRTAVSWVSRPAYALATLGLVLMLNVSAAVYFQQHLDQHEEQQFFDGMAGDLGAEATVLDW